MMEKIIITVEKSTRKTNFTKNFIGNDLENLQQELVFKFTDEFVEGSARLEYRIGNEKHHIPMTRDGESYTVPVKNVITKEGEISMQLVIVQIAQDEEIPVFKSNVFKMYCGKSINAQEEAPDDYEYWLDVIQTKLASIDEALEEVDNLNITAERVIDGVEISITDKEGQTTTEKVNDGAKGDKGDKGDDYVITPADYNSIANIVKQDIVIPTKVSDLDNDTGFITNTVGNLTNYYLKSQTYTKEEVNNIISQVAGVRLQKVNVLPQTGQNGVIYLVPNTQQEQQNIFNEYIWIDNDWELIGSTQIDLTGYATETWVTGQISDFMTSSEITNAINTALANYYTKTQVDALLSNKVDSDVLDNYVRNTDYATTSKGGIVKVNGAFGTRMLADDTIGIYSANATAIDGKADNYRPITPSGIDHAVKIGVSSNTETLTDTEKANAQAWLGIDLTNYITDVQKPVFDQSGQTSYESIVTNGIAQLPTASTTTLGMVRVANNEGLSMYQGRIVVSPANNSTINGKTNQRQPIVPSNLDHAVKVGVTTNTETLTSTEKTNAQAWLGIDNALTRKSTIDNVLVPKTMYDLGSTEQASLTLTLPTPASGDNYSCNDIYVAFKSGGTATTLNIVGNYEGDTTYLPSINCICELSFKYVCGTWVLVTKETEVSSS